MRKIHKARLITWLFLFGLFFFGLSIKYGLASDTHQRGQTHHVVYIITDTDGNPVTGQTVRMKVKRLSDDRTYDFSNGTWSTSPTTSLATVPYNAQAEYYIRSFTMDTAVLVSGDYAFIISNDDATYGDQQVEVVSVGDTNDLIRIHR